VNRAFAAAPHFITRTPIFVANAWSPGPLRDHDHVASAARSDHGRSPVSKALSRSLRCKSGSGILTGQTTPH
jgi:hypothetical protein